MTGPRGFRRMPAAALALAFLTIAPEAARGQARAPGAAAAAAVDFESYTFGSPATAGARSVTLVAIPFAARIVAAPFISVAASGALARGTVTDQAGATSTLSGLTDTDLRATLALEREGTAVALTAAAQLPTGHATLAEAEATVAGAIASDLLPFRISNWGSGGGGEVELSAVRAGEQGSAGIAASYRAASSFQPLADLDARYRPGGELRLRFALDRRLAGDRTLAFQLSYSHFGEDQWDATGLLRAGQRVLGFASYAAPVGSGVLTTYGGVLYRSGGALADAVLHTGVLSGLKAPTSETLLLLGSSARVPWRQAILLPGLDLRLLRREDGTGQGWLVAAGGSAELPVGDRGVRIVPSARLRLGQLLVARGAASGIRGFELGLGVRFGGAR